jgi:hypothetical protein
MRKRLTSAVVVAMLSIGIVSAQVPQQQAAQDSTQWRLRSLNRGLLKDANVQEPVEVQKPVERASQQQSAFDDPRVKASVEFLEAFTQGVVAEQKTVERTAQQQSSFDDPLVKAAVESLKAMTQGLAAKGQQAREANTCPGPGDSRVALNTEILFDGRLYWCVEVFEPNDAPGMANAPLKRRNAGLVRVQVVPAQ